MGLTFVPTPLGNLRDITLRAIDVLRDCDLVVAEDTRVARRLLSALNITGKRLTSYREQNAAAATEFILERAASVSVAVVSDAGTPGISDPGSALIVAARAAGVPVEVLPGPVAFVCAAVLSGFALEGLVFGGFVPRAAGARRAAFEAALASGATSAWYESPNRIAATLESLGALASETPVFVGRELTKRHEQQILGTAAQVLAALEQPVRGEIVLVIAPRAGGPAVVAASSGALDAAIDAALDAGLSVAAAAKSIARTHNAERSIVYARATARKRAREGAPGDAPGQR